MKYLIVKIDGVETPILFGNDVELSKVELPWPVVAGGVAIGQQIFFTCQGKVDYMGRQYGSRGLKDEIVVRSADYAGTANETLLGQEAPSFMPDASTDNQSYVMPESKAYKVPDEEAPADE